MCSLLIDTYIKDDMEKDRLLRAVETIPSVTKEAEWALRWIEMALSGEINRFAAVEDLFLR